MFCFLFILILNFLLADASPQRVHEPHPSNFPEFELITDLEDYKPKEKTEKTEEEKIKEYKEFVESDNASSLLVDKEVEKDLEGMARQETKEDSIFKAFKERIDHDPNQVSYCTCTFKKILHLFYSCNCLFR